MSERGINDLADLALFLPFSRNEKPQTAARGRKADGFEVIEKKTETGIYRGSATTCKT
jgi:hypothetical protein